MKTPLDGIQILNPEYVGADRDYKFHDLGFGGIQWQDKLYIYLDGQILGPVQKILRLVYVQSDYDRRKGGTKTPRVVMFGQGKKVGLYVNGVKSQLFDEAINFNFRDGHFWYNGRRGKQWCYVIDGLIHGWFEEVASRMVYFYGNDLVYWARREGKVAFWLNDQPLELFDAAGYMLACFRRAGEHIAYDVVTTEQTGRPRQKGIWYDGKVECWFSEIKDFKTTLTEYGLRYIGIDDKGQYLYFYGEFMGPYDSIELHRHRDLTEETLFATFTREGKQRVQVGWWSTKWFDFIHKLDAYGEYRLVIGYDKVGKGGTYSYYVNESLIFAGPDAEGSIKDGRLCFKKQTVETYAID